MAKDDLQTLAKRAKHASIALAQTSSTQRNDALLAAADALIDQSAAILSANAVDLANAQRTESAPTVIDRLRLNEARVEAMAAGLRDVVGLPDPIGEVVEGFVRPNGLRIRRVRVPLGVVGIVYENRPNVTSDAAGLCLKSANAALLRGSAGAITSNIAIASALRAGIEKAGPFARQRRVRSKTPHAKP